jgi:polar amino acid transport system substrate-binding protein
MLRGQLAGIGLIVLIGGAFCAPASHAAGEKELLAPTGHLRVGVYAGSPTSLVTEPDTKQIHGVTYDLGKEFAARLNVPVEYLQLQRIADVIDAIKDGKVDFTVTNATPARAKDVSFSQILLAVELGYLVPANSSIAGSDQIDAPGIRIGVTKGRTSCPQNSRMQNSCPPKVLRMRSTHSATANSMSMPPTRPSFSRC